VYFGFRKITCSLFPKPLNKDIFSVFGRLNEEYLRNLTCWEKSENRFGLNAPKLTKKTKTCLLFVGFLLEDIMFIEYNTFNFSCFKNFFFRKIVILEIWNWKKCFRRHLGPRCLSCSKSFKKCKNISFYF
jgi:hypothetical protein